MDNDAGEVFVPFLWALVERSVPSPIFAVGFTGVSYWLKGDVPESVQGKDLDVQLPIVKDAILQRQAERSGSPFGLNTGYVFIRGEDEFHEFDIKGEYVGVYNKRIPHMVSQVDLKVASTGASLKSLKLRR